MWSSERLSDDDAVEETLRELAHDLDYYEPNEEERNRDPSFYGSERLEKEVASVLARLDEPANG